MNHNSMLTQDFALNYSFVFADNLSELRCRACKGFIEIHQPNPSQPERILGTCPRCGVWYLIESLGEGEQIMLLQLPDLGQIPHPALHAPQA